MSSIRRKISSRLNGALSKGPITEEGKRRSSQNAISHGLLATNIVCNVERSAGFLAMIDQHMATFQPVNGVELGLVEEMSAAQWRIERTWCIENGLLNQALKAAGAKDVSFKDNGVDRLVEAFRQLSTDDAFRLVGIYEGRLHRRYHRAIQTLLLLRQHPQPGLDPSLDPSLSPCPDAEPESAPIESPSLAGTEPPACETPDNSVSQPENQMDKLTHFTDSLFKPPPVRYSLIPEYRSASFQAAASVIAT